MNGKRKHVHVAGNSKKVTISPWVFRWPLFALLVKIVILFNIPEYVWLGADGASYVSGTNAILTEGIFSKSQKLLYWPAGYPLIIALIAKVSLSLVAILLSLFQSILFAYATYFFVRSMKSTSITKYSAAISLIISVNPTLSLSSLVIGYESLVASLLLLSIGLLFQRISTKNEALSLKHILFVSLLLGISIFVQPRMALLSLGLFAVYISSSENIRKASMFITISFVIMSLLPGALVLRNVVANDKAAISTNFGTTMMIGAGNLSTGGPEIGWGDTGLNCLGGKDPSTLTESEKIICVSEWYLTNPVKAAKLMFSKTVFYWSPWIGPLAKGTMNKNPWLKFDPVVILAKNPTGNQIVYGPIGIACSWIFLLGGWTALILGAYYLFGLGGREWILGKFLLVPTLLGWLISLGTIGDHRFRIPQMGMSLTLQLFGFIALREKFLKKGGASSDN